MNNLETKPWYAHFVKWNCVFYNRPRPPLGVENFDAERIVADNVKAGVDTLAWELIDGFFDSKIQKKWPGLGGRDLVKELGEEAHRRGLRFVPCLQAFCGPQPEDPREPYYGLRDFSKTPPSAELAESHPEWFSRTLDGRMGGICPNSSFIDEYTIPLLKEVTSWKYTDGIWLDWPHFNGPDVVCFCENCRRKYKERFGDDLPKKMDWSDPNWRRFRKWHYENLRDWFKKSYEAIKSVRPDILVFQNYSPYALSNGSHDTGEVGIPEYNDVLSIEAFFDHGSFWMPGLRTKLGRAAGREKKPVWTIMHLAYTWHPLMATRMTRAEIEMRIACADVVASGGLPQLWAESYNALAPDYKYGGCHVLKACLEDMENIKEYITDVESLKYAALHYSIQSRDFYGLTDDPPYHGEPRTTEEKLWILFKEGSGEWSNALKKWGGFLLGCYKAFLRHHVPFDLFVDAQLSDPKELAKYKVLILPNSVCLSDKQVENIKQFVKKGGGLVATHRTSLANEEGIQRGQFALGDVFHAFYKDTTENSAPIWSYVKIVGSHKVVEGIDPDIILSHKREQLIVETDQGAEVPARIAYPRRQYYMKEDALYGFPAAIPGATTNHPAIVASTYGKGRIVYIPGQIDLLTTLWGVPYYDRILANAVEWVAGNKPLITDAPSTVEITLECRPGKERLLVHLVNFTCPPQWTSIFSIPTSNMIDEVVSVTDISVKVKLNRKPIRRVYAAITKQDLDWKITNDYVEFTVPRLYIHEIVVIE